MCGGLVRASRASAPFGEGCLGQRARAAGSPRAVFDGRETAALSRPGRPPRARSPRRHASADRASSFGRASPPSQLCGPRRARHLPERRRDASARHDAFLERIVFASFPPTPRRAPPPRGPSATWPSASGTSFMPCAATRASRAWRRGPCASPPRGARRRTPPLLRPQRGAHRRRELPRKPAPRRARDRRARARRRAGPRPARRPRSWQAAVPRRGSRPSGRRARMARLTRASPAAV